MQKEILPMQSVIMYFTLFDRYSHTTLNIVSFPSLSHSIIDQNLTPDLSVTPVHPSADPGVRGTELTVSVVLGSQLHSVVSVTQIE